MKKTYSAPKILFENFMMSTNIAGDCGIIFGVPTEGTCGGFEFGGDFLFMDTVQGCSKIITTDDGNSLICYHNPYDNIRLFNS